MAARVALFVTCLVDQIFPRVGSAMAGVLEGLGYSVAFPEAQTCCGQPAFNSGYVEEARKVARHFLKVFAEQEYVVVPSGSCTAMVGHHFSQLFRGDAALRAEAEELSKRVFEFSQFLTEVAQVDDVGARLERIVTYHDSCHALRELHVHDGPRRLLRHVQGLELREMDAAQECCGFGGTFSVKFAQLSTAMAQTKVDSIVRTGAATVVSIDSSCLMQVAGVIERQRLPVNTMHLAEVLASR